MGSSRGKVGSRSKGFGNCYYGEEEETNSIRRFYATQTPRRMSTLTLAGTTNAEVTKEAAAREEIKWALFQLETKWVPSTAAAETITMKKETPALAVQKRSA